MPPYPFTFTPYTPTPSTAFMHPSIHPSTFTPFIASVHQTLSGRPSLADINILLKEIEVRCDSLKADIKSGEYDKREQKEYQRHREEIKGLRRELVKRREVVGFLGH